MKKKMIKLNESDLKRIVETCVNKILKEDAVGERTEMIPTYEVLNKNVSLSMMDEILLSDLYNKNGNFVGKLSELFFRFEFN